MVAKKENYFRVQATKSIDNQDHYFIFNLVPDNDNDNITKFEYLKHISQRDLVKKGSAVYIISCWNHRHRFVGSFDESSIKLINGKKTKSN